MDRRLAITIGYLVLALVALAAAGLLSPAGAPAGAGVTLVPQPAPCPMAERPQAPSVLPVDASVAWQALAPKGMSGEFAKTRYASIGAHPEPSVYIPSEGWRLSGRHLYQATRAHRSGAPVC